RRTGNAEVALDQVLAEGRRVRRAATGAGEDDDRRFAFEARDQRCNRRRQDFGLPAHDVRSFAEFGSHADVEFAHVLPTLRGGWSTAASSAAAHARRSAPARASPAGGGRPGPGGGAG